MSEEFFDACGLDDVAAGGLLGVTLDGKPVAIVRDKDGAWFAIGGMCTHGPVLLAEGELDEDEHTVECWGHGSRFDYTTGEPKNLPAIVPVPTYPVRVEAGRVMVAVNSPTTFEQN